MLLSRFLREKHPHLEEKTNCSPYDETEPASHKYITNGMLLALCKAQLPSNHQYVTWNDDISLDTLLRIAEENHAVFEKSKYQYAPLDDERTSSILLRRGISGRQMSCGTKALIHIQNGEAVEAMHEYLDCIFDGTYARDGTNAYDAPISVAEYTIYFAVIEAFLWGFRDRHLN